MFMLGYAYQLGALPLSAAAIEQAIELNGEAVAMNHRGLPLGPPRRADPAAVEALVAAARAPVDATRQLSQTLDEIVARRVAFLTAYQNAAYAARYRDWVDAARAAEAAKAPGKSGLAEAVARYLFKLMAYKDEYEVARLYTDGAFLDAGRRRRSTATTALRVPSRAAAARRARDPATGRAAQDDVRPLDDAGVFRLLARLKVLRGTPFDPFGYTARAADRAAADRATTRRCSTRCSAKLTPDNHHLAVGLAAIPEKIRGFGHVKGAISTPPRPTRRRCSSSSAPARRRCSRRRSKVPISFCGPILTAARADVSQSRCRKIGWSVQWVP